jgi:asparagine synthase (glutamine-hydrolysing)
LLLARDRLGIKPLYVAMTGRELLFASEIKAILAAGGIRPALREELIPELLATRFVAGEHTLYRGIDRVAPGHTWTWSMDAGLTRRRYWQLPPLSADEGSSIDAEAPVLRERLRASVKRHLMSDVPLGVFLSGGLDSSALAALTSQLVDEPVRTFAVGFEETDANELPYARLVARAIGAQHHEVVVPPRRYFETLPQLVWHEDEPIAFTSSVPLYFVSALARQHVKVVLTGEGADELFLGYNRYRVTHWNTRLAQAYTRIAPHWLRTRTRAAVRRLPHAARRYASRSFLALDSGPRGLFFENFAVFPESSQRRVLADPALIDARDPYAHGLDAYARAPGAALDRMSRVDLATYLHELLMKQDQMSMAASVESRVPFLDDELVEYVAGLPSRLKLHGWQTKAILRAAVKDLVPPTILSRRKMGFPVPFGRWIRGTYAPVVDEFVLGARPRARRLFDPGALSQLAAEHRAGAADHGERLWLLINLEIWLRVCNEGEDPARVMDSVWRQTRQVYAGVVGEDGRAVAAQYGRPATQLSTAAGALAAPSGRPGHD